MSIMNSGLFYTLCVILCLRDAATAFVLEAEERALPPCGLPVIQPLSKRIVGGEEAIPGSWPWMALLAFNERMACGGSILNQRLVLTAAHCIDPDTFDQSPSLWQVYVGKHHYTVADETEQQIGLERIVIHSQFNNASLDNDLALLVLAEDIEYNEYTLPICVPPTSDRVVPLNTYCFVTGWGETRGTAVEGVLNQADVPILHDYYCSRSDWYGSTFHPEVSFCAGYKSGMKDACSGDSGGPLSCEAGGRWYVQGVTSWGHDCAQPQRPGIYVDVSKFSSWIRTSANTVGYPLEE